MKKKQEIILKYDRNKGMSFMVLFFVFLFLFCTVMSFQRS